MSKKPIERRRAGRIFSAVPESTTPLVKPLSDPATLLDRLVLTVALAPPRALARQQKQRAGPMTRRRRGEMNRG